MQNTEDISDSLSDLEDENDLSTVCRTCAATTESLIPIFEGEGLRRNLADKINKFLPIKVSPQDALPLRVCRACADTLVRAHMLARAARRADARLRARLARRAHPRTHTPPTRKRKATATTNTEENSNSQQQDKCAPTAAATVTRRTCPYCSLDWPDDAYKDHLLNAHANLLFLCDECDTYVDRKELITHMSLHAIQYDRIAAMRAAEKRRNETNTTPNKNDTCPDEMKARPNETNPTESNEPETDTCQNENVPVERSDQENRNVDSGTETSVADEPQENEFSDRSDSECKFGPLPDSVFEAIEDSQDAPRAARSAAVGRKRERTCPICAKTYTASSSYFYHMKHQHGDSREHECAQCGRRFGTRAGLAQHAPVHTGERRHECAQCGKRFASRAGLYVHARTHAAGAARRWQCADCGRGFAWRQALARHERRHAGAEGRAHGCNACGRRFAARYDLSRHARTHTPAALPCRYCAATFAQPRYLQVHMRRKHPAYTTATNT